MRIQREVYLSFKERSIEGRYVTNAQATNILTEIKNEAQLEIVGYSVQEKPIHSITIGEGKHKIFMWSQMHGNESTTTKALLDLLNFLKSDSLEANQILQNCTLKIILILNPDGAEAYTRVNANQVDLNRDAQKRSEPESMALRDIYENFQPDFCFNLHDQRTIFNVGTTSKPATVSFLAPAHNKERTISKTRGLSMQVIVAMNKALQELIPGQVGRYDDSFNANCVGDTFQMLGTPTILFEAGHFYEDYDRERTREYIFQALVTALDCIGKKKIGNYIQQDYLLIPENQKLFFDVIIKNAKVIDNMYTSDIAILFKEVLKDEKVIFESNLEKTECMDGFFGHKTYDCLNKDDFELLKKQDFWGKLQP